MLPVYIYWNSVYYELEQYYNISTALAQRFLTFTLAEKFLFIASCFSIPLTDSIQLHSSQSRASSEQELTDLSFIPSRQSYFSPAINASQPVRELIYICARSGQERSILMDPETTRLDQHQLLVDLSMYAERVKDAFLFFLGS